MIRFGVFLLAVTTAIDIQQPQEFNVALNGEYEIENSNYNSSAASGFFNSGIVHSALKIIEDVLFLKEVKDCRPNYPNMNTTTFYEHLYCYIMEGGSSSGTRRFCDFTDELVKKIRDRISDFVMFKSILDASVDCEQWYFYTTKSGRDYEIGGDLDFEEQKAPKLSHIYLGPSKYPLQTILIRNNVKPMTVTSSRTTFPEIETETTTIITTTSKSTTSSTTSSTDSSTSSSDTIHLSSNATESLSKTTIFTDKSNDLPLIKE